MLYKNIAAVVIAVLSVGVSGCEYYSSDPARTLYYGSGSEQHTTDTKITGSSDTIVPEETGDDRDEGDVAPDDSDADVAGGTTTGGTSQSAPLLTPVDTTPMVRDILYHGGSESTGGTTTGGASQSVPLLTPVDTTPLVGDILYRGGSGTTGTGTSSGGTTEGASAQTGTLTLAYRSPANDLILIQGPASASRGWGEGYVINSAPMPGTGQINLVYQKPKHRLVALASDKEKLRATTCPDALQNDRGTCSVSEIRVPNDVAYSDIYGWRIAGGSPWAAVLGNGDIHGFIEMPYDWGLYVPNAHQRAMTHIANVGDSDTFALDQPLSRNAYNGEKIDFCGLWGSDPKSLARNVNGVEEIHAFSFAASRKVDAVAFPKFPTVYASTLNRTWFDGTWHCDGLGLNDPDDANGGLDGYALLKVVDDRSAGGLGLIMMLGKEGGPFTLNQLTLATVQGRLKVVKNEIIPFDGIESLGSGQASKALSGSLVVAESGGAVMVAYATATGELKVSRKKATGAAWETVTVPGVALSGYVTLSAFATERGDLHVFAHVYDYHTQTTEMRHLYTTTDTNGKPGVWRSEKLARAIGASSQPVVIETGN